MPKRWAEMNNLRTKVSLVPFFTIADTSAVSFNGQNKNLVSDGIWLGTSIQGTTDL